MRLVVSQADGMRMNFFFGISPIMQVQNIFRELYNLKTLHKIKENSFFCSIALFL